MSRLFCMVIIASAVLVASAEPRSVSGIYPHLAMFNNEGECGTGAMVPWAGRLWVVTYAPHKPTGSTDRLYEITPLMEPIIHPESIGGAPANRMIHRESEQLFIGPYAIRADGSVRAIPCLKVIGDFCHWNDGLVRGAIPNLRLGPRRGVVCGIREFSAWCYEQGRSKMQQTSMKKPSNWLAASARNDPDLEAVPKPCSSRGHEALVELTLQLEPPYVGCYIAEQTPVTRN